MTARAPADESGALAGLAARLHLALAAAGEGDPQIEIWPDGGGLPAYQTAAWLRSALVWAREPASVIRLARSFDAVDARRGPQFHPDHPRIEDRDEIRRQLEYLAGAPTVLATGAVMPDALQPERVPVVPLSLRTDGAWIWSDSVAYYLEEYGLIPEPDLWDHLRAQGGRHPRPSTVALHRVWCHLLRESDGADIVWPVRVPAPA